MGPGLPLELLELILYDLADDYAALKSSALVSRTWLSSVRRLLFRNMTIDAATDFHTLLRGFESSPGIPSCVKSLKIHASRKFRPYMDMFLDDQAPDSLESIHLIVEHKDAMFTTVSRYLSRQPRLQTLSADVSLLDERCDLLKVSWLSQVVKSLPSTVSNIHFRFKGYNSVVNRELLRFTVTMMVVECMFAVDKVLKDRPLPLLKEVLIELELWKMDEEAQTGILEQLSLLKLSKAGKLRVLFDFVCIKG